MDNTSTYSSRASPVLSYARDTLGSGTEPFVVHISGSEARIIGLFAALGFGVVWSVTVFDEVEMQIVGLGGMSWPVGRVREIP